jgi:(p)ppGpp synthase/HD superfamily hydrolase
MKMIRLAIEFATAKHSGQTRKVSGEPYISHPIIVSYLLANYKTSKRLEELICAALLHDTFEDTDTSFDEISNKFTPFVASLVLELTNDEDIIGRIGKLAYFKSKWKGMSSYALTIKLCDTLSNISDAPSEQKVKDTIELLTYLQKVRKLSKTQKRIVDDILAECNKKTTGVKVYKI